MQENKELLKIQLLKIHTCKKENYHPIIKWQWNKKEIKLFFMYITTKDIALNLNLWFRVN